LNMRRDGAESLRASSYLEAIGVWELPPLTAPFDPGYDLNTVVGHLEQGGHLMSSLKISMACWQIANDRITRQKFSAARKHKVPTCAGGGPFEVAAVFQKVPEYLDLCASMGAVRIEAGEGFTDVDLDPLRINQAAAARGLEVQYELGGKTSGAFTHGEIDGLVGKAKHWMDAGSKCIVVEGRESAQDVGLFSQSGELNTGLADRLLEAIGMSFIVFEAPTKHSQFALLDHYGPHVQLSNVRLEELLRVEIYRRGLHSDAFQNERLRPQGPSR
jgi:phosphosulfolactate synthase